VAGLRVAWAAPLIILKRAIEEEATSIILTQNHPSGSLRPGKADEDITNRIIQAASYVDIKVIDQIIVSEEGNFIFEDEDFL
jgi:DNA repair protein RadC